MILMRFTDIFLALPSMLLMIVLNAILQPGLVTLIFVLSLFSWAQVARITRAETMSVKERDYVIATKNLGAGSLRIAFNHIIPNILGPVVVAASLGVASAILMESSLSFLGLGVTPPTAEWGALLSEGRNFLDSAPWVSLLPASVVALSVIAITLLGRRVQTLIAKGGIA